MGDFKDNVNPEKGPKIDFHHPYTPYEVQEQFMRTVYDVLEKGQVGILESPTGTVCLLKKTKKSTKNYKHPHNTQSVSKTPTEILPAV